MDYKLVKWTNSNYELTIILDEKMKEEVKLKVLKEFQKDISVQWFRKWHAPMDMVEAQIRPWYVDIAMLEDVVHKGMHKVLDEHKDLQFIGHPYDFNPTDLKVAKWDNYEVTFKIDIYPQAEAIDKKWEKATLTKISTDIPKDKKDTVISTILKQYSDYENADTLTENAISKLSLQYLDKDGNELLKKSIFVGDEEFEKEPETKKLFDGIKLSEEVERDYTEKTVPEFLKYTGEWKPKTMKFVALDIKKVVVPELNDSFVKEKFGDANLNSVDDLMKQIDVTLNATQWQEELQTKIEEFLNTIWTSFTINIPQTFIQEELKHRMKSMEDQLWWEAWLKKFLSSMGDEKSAEYIKSMEDAAKESLKKFFLLRKVVEDKGLTDVDRSKWLDAEKKLYAIMTWDTTLFAEEKTA